MMSLGPQSHSPFPGAMQQHPGVPQGHMGMPHQPGQQIPGQPGMNPQMHMGVSGPGGPQVTQAGAMMGGPSQHALQHLNPGAAQQAAFMQQQQQQQMAFANNPGLMQQQMHIQQQRQQQQARQVLMAQSYSGNHPNMPMMPNGMTQMQFAQQMRQNPMARPVNLPQHLQQQQQQVSQQQMTEQQLAAQQQHHHQQQQMLHQMALHQQQQQQQHQAQAGNPQAQMNQQQQQMHSMQQVQLAAQHQQQQQQQAQAQAAAVAAAQQNQPQPPPQQAQPNAPAQAPQNQPPAQQPPNMQQQQQQAAMIQAQQQRQGDKIKGQCLMMLMQFGDHLSNFQSSSKPLHAYMAGGAQRIDAQSAKQKDDLNYWGTFVERFFSPNGVMRHSVWIVEEKGNSDKQYEITFSALARYFHTHFESGIKNIQLIMEKGSEKELPNNGHYIESQKSSFVYWFANGSQLIASGTLRAHFDADQKIELLEFATANHEEYFPRSLMIEAARPLHDWGKEWKTMNSIPDGKQSPEMNKKKNKTMKSPQQPPPDFQLPASKVKTNMGVTPEVFRFFEIVEVMGQMNPLFMYSHKNSTLSPRHALETYVNDFSREGANPNAQQKGPPGPRTPGFAIGASPAAAHLQLPDGSPHMGSPAQAPGMQLQQSQHGTSSSGPSANTSPNASNKRRRPSAVKAEEENQMNGTQTKAAVKPSPRIGGKRQKGNP